MAANEPGQPAVNPIDPSVFSHNHPAPARALAVGAHPDDIEFGCGATLAKWAAEGCVVHYAVLTDGSKGTWDVNADTQQLVAARQSEQREAARRIGATGSVTFLGAVDGELENTHALRDQLSRLIRIVQPDVVLGHDPWKRYRLHPDHRAAGFLLTDSIVAARDPHYFGHHGLAVHRPDAVLLFEADDPDHVEDISDSIDAKIQALLAHRSQFVTTHGIPQDDDGTAAAAFGQRIDGHAAQVGAATGVPRGECFKLLTHL